MGEDNEPRTLIGVLADGEAQKAALLRLLTKEGEDADFRTKLENYHFVFTADSWPFDGKAMDQPARFFADHSTLLPTRAEGGVTYLANLVVQQQCSILWTVLDPLETWARPEDMALMRLADFWNVKRLMTPGSILDWAAREAARDIRRNRQPVPVEMLRLGQESLAVTSTNGRLGAATDDVVPTLALISHDGMKPRMVDFCVFYENELCTTYGPNPATGKTGRILATGTTGQEIRKACRRIDDLKLIQKCHSGPRGGDVEIATEILLRRCGVVVFFVDPLSAHPHVDDIRVVFSACMRPGLDVRMLTNEVHAREWFAEEVRREGRPSQEGARDGPPKEPEAR